MDVPVLIVGGGPIGLTASVLLSHFGIESMLVNDRATTSTHPRARFLDVRTAEILEQVGLFDSVNATGLPVEWLDSVRYSATMIEPEVLRLPTASYDCTPRDISPVVPIMTSQDLVEPIMFDAARSFDAATVSFGTEVVALESDETGVTVRLQDRRSAERRTVRAGWVIGADGRGSVVRDLAHCGLAEGTVGAPVQDVLYHGDMSAFVGDRTGALLFVFHPMGYGLFQPLNGADRWRAQCTTFTPAVDPDDVTPELCEQWIRSAMGDDTGELDIDILSIAPWQPEERVADRFRDSTGRVLLVGDAAHTIFPTGGYGMNLGYHGIHNLIWKLATVIRDRSDQALLDTYEAERRPRVALTLATATENARRAGAMYRAFLGGGDESARAHAVDRLMQYGNFDGMVLGGEYVSTLCQAEPEPGPVVDNEILDFVPTVRAGRRAPHAWIDAAGTRSVLAEFGRDYVVLVPDAVGEIDSDVRQAAIPPSDPYRDDEVVLVRPDGVVAGRWSADDPAIGTSVEALLPV
ncbi:MAG: FAD-dependent monooxygenase [Actinomycetota bacterium]